MEELNCVLLFQEKAGELTAYYPHTKWSNILDAPDIEAHIDAAELHTTQAEKNAWNNAATNAADAKATADEAKGIAEDAKTLANAAKDAAGQAETTAADAKKIASDAAKSAAAIQDKINSGEFGGGSGCVLKITFDAAFVGQTYTVTDGNGDTKTGTVPAGLVESVSVSNCNTTYTITSTADDVTYSNTVTTGAYFGQYAATLAVFKATIQVTAASGAEVKAVCNGSTYTGTANSSGVATITVKKSGTYTISAMKDNTNSNTATVSVTADGGSYTATVKFITLTLTAPSGSAITVKNGATSLTGTSTGKDVFYLPNTGTWTVTIAKSGETASGSVSVSAYANYTLDLAFVHIYGASWDGTSTTAWTRTDEAALFIDPTPALNNGSGSSPFDKLQPWAGMVKSERTGGTMVAIPKFWYKLTQSGSGMKIQIADKATSGFSVSPAHMDKGDGKGERDVVYIGRYHCADSTYKSTTGAAQACNMTRSAARAAIHNLGTNIWQNDFALRFTLWLLYIVEFADWNSQAKIGYGCSANNSKANNGQTDSMKYHTGTTAAARTTYGFTQYRYIEGLWDNVYDWCDGCYNNSNGLNLILNPNKFSDNANGISVGTPSSGWPSAFSVKTAGGFPLFIPSANSGSDGTYSCDYWYFSASYPCVLVGGFGQSTYHGLFYIYCTTASGASAYFGSRLQELP